MTTADLRSREVQADDARPVGERRRSLAPVGTDAPELARTGDRAHARPRWRRVRKPRARRGGWSRRPDPAGRGARGPRRQRPGDGPLAVDPDLRSFGGEERRLRERCDAGHGRRAPRPGRRVVRRRDVARRAHLLPRSAAGAARDAARPRPRGTRRRDRLRTCGPERLLQRPRFDHPAQGEPRPPAARAARAVQPREPGRRRRGAAPRRIPRRQGRDLLGRPFA